MLFGTQTINQRGHLEVGGCDTVELARTYGTPLYVIDEGALRQRCIEYREAFQEKSPGATVAFASKAFLCKSMARLASEAGLHLDVASLGELRLVAEAGVPLDKVTLHGNYKKDEDIEAALDLGVGLVALDSADEYRRLSELAAARGTRQRAVLRVSPGIDAHTLDAISTGRNDTKFGITVESGAALDAVEECLSMEGIELIGIHSHIGSQILDIEPFQLLAAKLMDFLLSAREKTAWSPELVVLGGGLGIQYEESDKPPDLAALAEAIATGIETEATARGLDVPRIGIEPGRSIVGELGLTLYEVGPIKTVPSSDGNTRTYVSVDGGLSDNPRPVMYGSPYPVLLANRAGEEATSEVISGRHCETDTLVPRALLPGPKSGDLLAVLCTGAYNHTMASNYNYFYRPAVVFVEQGKAREVVRRETQEDLLARDLG